MDSAHRMRCLMLTSNFRQRSLATGLLLQYSPADGERTEWAGPCIADGLYRDHAVAWFLGLHQASGDDTEPTQAAGRCCTIHCAGTWRHTGLSRWVLQ